MMRKFFILGIFIFVFLGLRTNVVSQPQVVATHDKNTHLISSKTNPKLSKAKTIKNCNNIKWNWERNDFYAGYKYNFTNDITTAIDNGKTTSISQNNLICDKTYKLFVWGYNDKYISEVLILEEKTLPWTCGCTFIDERDMQSYKTVKIGETCWMAQNLNYETKIGSSCYHDSDSLCDIYGRFYSLEAALQSCPDGWKVPSLDDVENLISFYSCSEDKLYEILMTKGNNAFAMQLGGHCDPTGKTISYDFVGTQAGIWTTTKSNKTSNHMLFCGGVLGCRLMKANIALWYFVRCVKK
jgi:uncharacterized protein (TIGR02145 family)